MKESKKHGGNQQECKVIQQRANQWCKDNGYPIQTRRYVYNGKMKKKK